MSEQRLRYTEIAPQGFAAMRGVEHYCNTESGLEPVLLELVRLRASLLNGCEYCIGLHSHELGKHNEPTTRIETVGDWRGSDAFTQRERAAFAWTEVVTNIQNGHASDEAYEAALEHFSPEELVNLTIAIASINAWNRMAIAFRAKHVEKKAEAAKGEERSAVGDDGGKVVEE
jgi:AhpD family alkylhydroperoxidase